jgi:uncharacterized protein (TIRG00374 family)
VSWLSKAAALAGVAALGVAAVTLALWRYDQRASALATRLIARIPRLPAERVAFAAHHALRGSVALRRADVAAAAAAVTVASWVVMAASFWVLLRAFGLELGPGAGVLVVVTVNLTLVLPSSPAGLGLFEAATVVALHAYRVPQSQALSYALVLHAMNFAPFVLIGAAILAHRSRERRREGAPGRPPSSTADPSG